MQLHDINTSFRFSAIYKWENTINGKVYIGQSRDIYIRFKSYKQGIFNEHMAHAISKYGLEAFDIEIIERDVPLDKLNEREQYWMDYYQSYKSEFGYNICPEAGSIRGLKDCIEVQRKKARTLTGRCGTDAPFFGHHHTPETRKQMSESHTGVHTGRPITEEQRRKMQEGARKTVWKPVAKISLETGETIATYPSLREAARQHDVNKCGIQRCCVGLQDSFLGFAWAYIDKSDVA